MLKKKLGVLVAVVLTTITLVVVHVNVTQAVAELNVDGSDLELSLSTSKNMFIRGEPIPFHFTLLNRGSQTVAFFGFLGLGGEVNLLVRNPDGTESKWEGKKHYPLSGTGYGKARPNEPLRNRSLLDDFKLLDGIFPVSGRYSVRVEFVYRSSPDTGKSGAISTTSNAVELDIVEPADRDREAYDFIVSRFVRSESKFSIEAYNRDLETFVARYPDTVYGKFLVFKLAQMYNVTGREQEALRELCKVSDESFYFSDQVQRKLNEIDEKLHPTTLRPNLPHDATIPTRPHPCTRGN